MKASTHWIQQRFSGLFLCFTVFLLWNLKPLLDGKTSYEKWVLVLKNWPYALSFLLIVVLGCYHARLGLTIIIQDYIKAPYRKILYRFMDSVFFILIFMTLISLFKLFFVKV